MKICIALILVFIINFSAYAQKTVSDLKPAHAAALERFISKHPNYGFLSERAIEADYLNQAAKWFGKRIVPYYQIADFNRDGIQDFAMILSREGEPEDTGSDVEEFRYDHPLVIVIFNDGRRGTYAPAFINLLSAGNTYDLNNLDDPSFQTKIEAKLLFDFDAKSEFIAFYIPETPHTYGIFKYLAENYKMALELKNGVGVESGFMGRQQTSFKELQFTKRVFIYHESTLMKEQKEEIDKLFKKKKLSLIYRDSDYAFQRNNPITNPRMPQKSPLNEANSERKKDD